MSAVVLRDPDLHAHLMGPRGLDTVQWFGGRVAAEADAAWREQALWVLEHHAEDPAGASGAQLLGDIHEHCPPNLAERLAGALGVYRAVGRMALPPLMPLANRLLQAELHLYNLLKRGKPYRDHLAHQTRVAALAHLWLGGGADLPLPEALGWSSIRRRWRRTPEYDLLRCHALERGLRCPDPTSAPQGDDPWTRAVAAAALMAGLVHPILITAVRHCSNIKGLQGRRSHQIGHGLGGS